MSADRWQRVSEIYHEAIDRPVDERQQYVRHACAGDESLRNEVESLLAADRNPVIVDTPAFEVAARVLANEARASLIGRRLGVYQITAFLGAGGMGDVYRARDSKLGREVAIKVLSDSFAHDPGWRTRFHREGTVLAALNHPNIGAIYGIEEFDGVNALVLELVEGPTLADRLAQAPIPPGEALPIAMQIAEAIEAAHERGIVHRDLKPANIKLRPDGVVKVLDFGLAKAIEPTGESPANLSPSPGITMTQAGVILGTAAYMSPEQVRGRAVDKRSDVWASGCVLFEMLTGKRAFGGDDVAETFASVIGKEPDWSALPANTPSSIRRLLQRALTKEPRNRLADASMARLEIEEALTMPYGESAGAALVAGERPRVRPRVTWVLIGALAVAAAVLFVPAALYFRAPVSAESVQFLVDTPTPRSVYFVGISPDGRTIAYAAQAEDGRAMLYLRPIGSVSARPIAGTEDAWEAFWSPDSRSIGLQVGFGPNATLKTVEVSGGPPRTIARCGAGSWNQDGVIICWDGETISRVSATGGALTRITTLNESLAETGHRFPYFLPDGRHFLYLAASAKPENRAVYVGALDSDLKTRIMTVASRVVYAPPGFLLFQRQGTLFAQRFDATRLALQGEAVRITDGIVSAGNGNGAFAASSTGTLVYRGETLRQLTLFDRQGQKLGSVGRPGLLGGIALSADEKRIAFSERGDIWTLEISTGISSRLTFDPASESEANWAPDSRTVVFASNRTGKMSVFQRSIGSQDDVLVYESKEGDQWPDDWSRDGRYILINDRNAGIVALPTMGDRKPIRQLLSNTAVIDMAQFSPDGRWVAYGSTESGQAEIHVASFQEFISKQVSAGGGNNPQWRGDGKELFYMTGDGQVMAVDFNATGSTFDNTAPQKLFATNVTTGVPGVSPFAVSNDGQRILVLNPVTDRPTPITVLLNWTSLLK